MLTLDRRALLTVAALTAALALGGCGGGSGMSEPDGRLVFARGRYPDTELYTARPDGSDLRRVAALSGHQYSPRWSPDGSLIAFGSTHEPTHGLFIIRPNGTGLRRVTNAGMTTTHGVWGITWSPDGRWLVYGHWQTYSYSILRRVGLDGSGPTTVVDIGGESAWPDISWRDGRLVFSRQRGSWSPSEVLKVAPPSLAPPYTDVFTDYGCARECRWSPSSDDIILAHSPGGWAYENFDIFVIRSDGSNRRRLTNDNVQDADPCFSPDGSRIVWARANGAGAADLWMMNSDGTAKTAIPGLTECGQPDWSRPR
ncbi:MAG: hypothetical protein FJX72_08595 [Armatimonadetes bacterium]|nr:hypothetical protein [Armatimonadota bacterium]